MADTKVLEAFAVRCAGSSPVPGTSKILPGTSLGSLRRPISGPESGWSASEKNTSQECGYGILPAHLDPSGHREYSVMVVRIRPQGATKRSHFPVNLRRFQRRKQRRNAADWKFSLGDKFVFSRQAQNRAKINESLAINLLTADSVNPIGCGCCAGKPHPVVVSKALISSSNLLSPLASVRQEQPLNHSFFPVFHFSFHAKNLSSRLQDLRP